MKQGKVEKYIYDKIEKEKAVLSVLIDPCDYSSPKKAVETAVFAFEAGADLIAIGGSIGAQGRLLDEVTSAIKDKVKVPVALFPGNIATLTPCADAVYFMSLLNSRNPYWISQAQMLASPVIKKMGIEPIPMGYIVVEPGGTVGWVGDANMVPRHKPKIAAALAMAGEFSGCHVIYTDAGSAANAPVPVEMVKEVASSIGIPYLVGGGIRTPEQASETVLAGADWLQVGTVAENAADVEKTIGKIVKAIKAAGKKKD